MGRLSMFGLRIVVVLAVSAVAASSASAKQPTRWHALSVCENVGNGNGSFVSQADCERYANESPGGTWAWKCIKVTSGNGEFPTQEECRKNKKYHEAPREWIVETQPRLQLANGQTVIFEGESKEDELRSSRGKITCTSSTSKGELNGQVVEKMIVTYTKCKGPLGLECTSTGEAKGVIKTESLHGELVWTKKTEGKPAGLLLTPETGVTKEFLKKIGGCGEEVVFGSLIGEITPEKTLSTSGDLIFKENAEKTGQQWRQVEEAGVIHELEGEKFESKKFDEVKDTEIIRYHQNVEIE
jgi:hypothetical protein